MGSPVAFLAGTGTSLNQDKCYFTGFGRWEAFEVKSKVRDGELRFRSDETHDVIYAPSVFVN